MSEPTFQRVAGTSLFWLPASGRTIAFYGTVAGDAPTLGATWADAGGAYLFLGAAPASDADFAQALPQYLRSLGWPRGPRFVWLAGGDGSYSAWTGQALSVAGSGGAWTVSRRADFRFRSYALTVASGGPVALAGEGQGWGWAFGPAGSYPAATFAAPGGAYPAKGGTLLLPLAGPTPGCFTLSIDLPNGADPTPDFARLGAGIRYFHPDPLPDPDAPGDPAASGDLFVAALSLPALVQPRAGTLTLYVALDPLRPLVPGRTHLSFIAPGGGRPGAMDSTFATARGYAVTLSPRPAAGAVPDARLVFARQPLRVGADGNVPTELYLTPDGAFDVGWQASSRQAAEDPAGLYRLLCGSSGMEYVGVPSGAAAALVFVPGMPAYSPLRPAKEAGAPALEPLGTTAWVYPSAPAATVRYYAQPEDAPLFQAPAAAAARDAAPALGSVFLDFLETPAVTLPPWDGARAFPVAPLRGLPGDAVAAARALEARALAPARRQAILSAARAQWAAETPGGAAASMDVQTTGVTPQGFAVGIGSDGMSWSWLGIANGGTGTAARPDLGFTAVSGAFRQAIQTNRLFMVMASADVFAGTVPSATYHLTAAGIDAIRAAGTVPAAVLDAVRAAFAAAGWPGYPTEAAFVAALVTGTPAAAPYALAFVQEVGPAAPGSVAYRLTAEGVAEIAAAGTVPAAVVNGVRDAFAQAGWPQYPTEAAFVAALVAGTPAAAPYVLEFERQAGLLEPAIDDWRFQLSPRNWANPARQRPNGMLVFKFARGRSLRQLAEDAAAWAWPEAGVFPGGTLADTQAELRSIFADAADAYERTRAGGRESPYAGFVRLVDDPDWSGILALSVDVPLRTLPEPLQALAAGIDPGRFYAHHLGFNATPFGARPGVLEFGRTSTFGLIDYQDPEDQYFEENVFFAFKVLRLTVGFRNSAIASFSSSVQLLVNRLLGAATRLFPTEHGNNVVLDGVYQTHLAPDGREHGAYVFSMVRQNTLQLEASAVRRVALTSTQLVTTRPAVPGDPASKVTATFVMGGDLHFYLPTPFDPFSFGTPEEVDEETRADAARAARAAALAAGAAPAPGPAESALRFGNLGVVMEFTLAERKPVFSLVTETLSFDLANSRARPGALYAGFPLRLTGFLATPDPRLADAALPESAQSAQDPSTQGYVSAGGPIQQSRLIDPWYGLVYEVDLGTLGALAGSAGLALRLLVAWSGGGTGDAPAVYVGVRLPGVKDALGVELPLQGVMSLGFRTIEFVVAEGTGPREYMLRFRNFALRFLGISFPPGYNDILLFGNPDATSRTKLGWYAAYSAEKDEKRQQQPSPQARMFAARRGPAPLALAAGGEGDGGGAGVPAAEPRTTGGSA